MSPEKQARAVAMLKELRQDCADDAVRRDGMPFTGRNVAEALGGIGAQVAALASVLIAMLEEGEGDGV